MPDTRLTWPRFREHLRKYGWIYLVGIAVCLVCTNLLWTTTAPRVPDDQAVVIFLADGYSNPEPLADVAEAMLKRSQEYDKTLEEVEFQSLMYADPSVDYTIMSQPIYASIYASLKTRLASVRTLPFRLEIEGTGSDGSFASLIYTISGVQYIDKYYNPQITLDAWRYPNDEATALAATMRVQLAEGNNASRFTAKMYYARDAKATTASTVFDMNVSRDVLFGVGYSANTSVLPGTFVNGSVYSFLLVVSDGIETASAMCVVDRAFANLHLAGLSTGGVAIGKFSAATQGNPLFECAFPIVLSGSKTYGPESSMPSNPVEGQLYFVVE